MRLAHRSGSNSDAVLRALSLAPSFDDTGFPEAVAAAVAEEARLRFGADAALVVRRLGGGRGAVEARWPTSTVLPPGRVLAEDELLDGSLVSPLAAGPEPARVLALQWASGAPELAAGERLVLRRFADQAALALEHADRRRAEDEAQRNLRQTHRLLAVGAALAAAHSVREVTAAVIAEGEAQTGAVSVAIRAAPDGASGTDIVLAEPPRSPSRSTARIPLLAGASVVGIAELVFPAGHVFDAQDREFLASLGRQGGLALERARLHADEVRAREEAELRASAAQALEFVGEGVFMTDRDGVVLVWNPTTETVTGLPAHEVVGRRAHDVVPWWEAFAERVPVLPAGERPAPRTLPVETAHGEAWLSVSGIRFDEGVVYAFRDVTDEHGVERLKSDFIATISHELRTPLAVLYGGAATLGRPGLELAHGDRQRLIEMMVAEGERLERLVDRILFASSLENDAVRVTAAPIRVADLLRALVGELAEATAARIRLTVADTAADRVVVGDADQLREIVSNLVDNAVKYSPAGTAVEIRLAARDGRIRISVADEGPGVPRGDRERVFDKFFRADSQLTLGVRGTGLGLYIVRELVHRLEGRVWVEPGDGRGAVFVVELPTPA
jgi:PAS domain S-box-containing protein